MNTKRTAFYYLLAALLTVGFYFVLTGLIRAGVIGKYHADMLIPVGFYIMLAVSLNLTCGFLGQLPLGHAGFMAVGAYTSALATRYLPFEGALGFWIALLLGALMAAAFGVVVGLPALRLSGDYLAIITLGFGEIIKGILLNLNFTGGARGFKGIPKQTDLTTVYICLVLTLFFIRTLINSRFGRAIISIRENEIAAESCGIHTTFYKTMTFSIAAFFAGLAGGLYAHYIGVLYPTTFGFDTSIEILVMVVLGGMGSITGSVISAATLRLLPEMLRAFLDYRMVIYSLLLIVVMIFRPTGLMGRYEFRLSKIFAPKGDKSHV
jgi:branched-chain amino acid transport system permease protein